MKVLIDACLAGSVAPALVEAGHEVECVVDWSSDPGDEAILGHAKNAAQVVLTIDEDFGELAVVRAQPHSGIVRLVGFTAAQQANACLAILNHYAAELAEGALITAEPGRTRVRPKDA